MGVVADNGARIRAVMTNYDLCFAWNWEYDLDFFLLLEKSLLSHDLTLLQITPDLLPSILMSLAENEVSFRACFDRASDSDRRFTSVIEWACRHNVYRINRFEQASLAWNKAAMHRAVSAALCTPYTIIIPAYDEDPLLPSIDLRSLGLGFVMKPAHGGGGDGVVMNVHSMDEVLTIRKEYSDDQYLLQSRIVPVQLGSRPAWFRVIYCFGRQFLFWWYPGTFYDPVSHSGEEKFDLKFLRRVIDTIAGICGLDVFSSEIALIPDGRFVVIDYVNDPIDLRLQSKTGQGVPDNVICEIAEILATRVRDYLYSSQHSAMIAPLGARSGISASRM
ncbi:MAG: hypothetical protein V1736_05055 [Pseudomonadota bacterium]